MLIGLTGSTGHLGRRVAERLTARSAASAPALRLLVRDPSRAPRLPGEQVAVASYADRDAVRDALRGVDLVLMVSAAEDADRRHHHRTFVTAASEAGVRHVVYTSFFNAAPDAVFTLSRDHFDTEQALRESGLDVTFLRDNFYADVWPHFADERGVIRGPAGQGRVSAVARADVADAAAAVLLDPAEHRGATYHLTGPEAVTLSEMADRASRVLGRPLRFEDQTPAQAYASRAVYGAPTWQVEGWVSTYLAIAAGQVAEVSDDVARLTGHAARTLEQCWRDEGP